VPAQELLVRLELALGRIGPAEAALATMDRSARSFDSPALSAAVLASRAAVAAATGRDSEAADCLEDAADLYHAGNMPFEAACCRRSLAALLVRLGRSEPAARAAHAAVDALRRLGAKRELARAEEVLASLTPGSRCPSERSALLTPREREVLALVADGRGDREIADRLMLSRHTVHRHLSNIRGKLGVSSRSAAVARALSAKLL
jgi:LuxR family maltose regulon positive regulatory protein